MNGTWVGTLESPDRGVQQVSLTVVQFANCVDGTWKSSSSDAQGALSGFAGKDSYTGLLSFELGSCLGVVEVTGNVGADSLRLTGGQVAKSSGSGACAAPLPESVVLSETRNIIYDIVRENQQRGATKEAIDQRKEEIYSYASNSAKERIKAAFLLGRIAEKEGIKVTKEEITNRILFLAQQYQMKPDKFLKQLQERDGLSEIQEQILTSKVLDFLQLSAKIEEVPPSSPA